MLGSGGFSSVYEVESFDPDSALSAGVTQSEQASRQFLTDHVRRTSTGEDGSKDRRRKHRHLEGPISRYAVKHLRHTLTRHPERFQRAALDLIMEGQLLLAIDHPNIISVRGWSYYGPDAYRTGKYSEYFLILDRLPETLDSRIMEWRHSLRKYRSRVTLPWARKKYATKIQRLVRERVQAAHDIASALEYLHDRRIINRDVKTANIGLDVHGDIKVFDFGLSRLLPDEDEKLQDGYAMSRVGTRLYMAPEVRNKKPYDLSADVYSFGVVLWELMALSTPKDNLIRTSRQFLEDSESSECWLPICTCWPADIQDVIRRCLAYEPSSRPTMRQVRDVLKRQMASLGMSKTHQQKRRRSTFRLDLSKQDLASQLELLNLPTLEGSAESKTSRMSLFESDELMQQ